MKSWFLYAGILITGVISGALRAQIPRNGLILHLPLDSHFRDESGSFVQTSPKGGIGFTSDRLGNPKGAIYLDGIDDEVNTNLPGPQDSSARSIAFWAKYLPTSKALAAVGYGGNGVGDRFNCGFNFFGTGPMIDVAESVITYKPTPSSLPNDWHHYAFVLEGPGTTADVKVYQDGALLTTWVANYKPSTRINTSNSYLVNIGRVLWKAGKYDWFQGFLDDIVVYNHALDTQEIQMIMNGCPELSQTQAQLLTAKLGDTALFTCHSPYANCQFQWQLNQGFGFQNIDNAGPFAGTNRDSLTVTLYAQSLHNSVFRCLLNWNGCRDTSANQRLLIDMSSSTTELAHMNCTLPSLIRPSATYDWSSVCGRIQILSLSGQKLVDIPAASTLTIPTLNEGMYIFQTQNQRRLIYCIME